MTLINDFIYALTLIDIYNRPWCVTLYLRMMWHIFWPIVDLSANIIATQLTPCYVKPRHYLRQERSCLHNLLHLDEIHSQIAIYYYLLFTYSSVAMQRPLHELIDVLYSVH